MKCKNCNKEAGPRANKHVKNRKYTCRRPSSTGLGYDPSIVVETFVTDYTDYSSTDYSSDSGSGYNSSSDYGSSSSSDY